MREGALAGTNRGGTGRIPRSLPAAAAAPAPAICDGGVASSPIDARGTAGTALSATARL
jgi:hypothetical protein